MIEKKHSYGMIGLGTMGLNLVMNMCDNGYTVAGYDKDLTKVELLNSQPTEGKATGYAVLQDFIDSLELPRTILMLVPAGPIVDGVISDLLPFLSPKDIIIDCGNSHFTDTSVRIISLEKKGLHFMGLGVSGGELGARLGPSIMPGGDREAYDHIEKMIQDISAKKNGEPCTAYMGKGAAGHYVKMIHNGIEYALMQLLAESYHLLKVHGGLSNKELHDVFASWNHGRLQSYLVEITAAIFQQPDEKSTGDLLDSIADKAKQKGTGAWTSEEAMKILAPIPTIDAAVTQRVITSMKKERVAAYAYIGKKTEPQRSDNLKMLLEELESALYASFLIVYAQGFSLLQRGSKEHEFGIDMESVAAIWRGGCIIRAELLEDITRAYKIKPDIVNLLLAPAFADAIKTGEIALRKIVGIAAAQSIPCGAFSATLNYYDSYFSAWLPANLIQAQRDFFGAHTYERNDMEGIFHTQWNEKVQ